MNISPAGPQHKNCHAARHYDYFTNIHVITYSLGVCANIDDNGVDGDDSDHDDDDDDDDNDNNNNNNNNLGRLTG